LDTVPNKAKYHKLHYNLVAKVLRDRFEEYVNDGGTTNSMTKLIQTSVVVSIALDFAHKFLMDNPSFDPLKFLDACSPDVDLYPLSELWDAEKKRRN
jgi:hypothetical protein